MQPIVANVPWSVCLCLCVGHIGEPCKNGGTSQEAVWNVDLWGTGDLKNHVLGGDQDYPMGKDTWGQCLMFISLHFYFSLCSIWPPCACISVIRRNSGPRSSFYCLGHFKNVCDDDDDDDDHWLMAPPIKSWLIVRCRPLPDNLAALPVWSIFCTK